MNNKASMKKFLCGVMILTLMAALLTGCGSTSENTEPAETTEESTDSGTQEVKEEEKEQPEVEDTTQAEKDAIQQFRDALTSYNSGDTRQNVSDFQNSLSALKPAITAFEEEASSSSVYKEYFDGIINNSVYQYLKHYYFNSDPTVSNDSLVWVDDALVKFLNKELLDVKIPWDETMEELDNSVEAKKDRLKEFIGELTAGGASIEFNDEATFMGIGCTFEATPEGALGFYMSYGSDLNYDKYDGGGFLFIMDVNDGIDATRLDFSAGNQSYTILPPTLVFDGEYSCNVSTYDGSKDTDSNDVHFELEKVFASGSPVNINNGGKTYSMNDQAILSFYSCFKFLDATIALFK